LHNWPYLVNAWTHAIVAFELSFSVLIWNRLTRPLMLAIGVVMWSLLALVTGVIAFSVVMVIATLAFVSPEQMHGLLDCCFARREVEGAEPQVAQASSEKVKA
jgi:hypothetical protein